MNLKEKKLYLLDMDGTLYLDNDLFEGVHAFLDAIKSRGGRYLFLTNNSSKSVEKYVQKLCSLGISATSEEFLTSTNATILDLQKHDYKKIYAFGTTSFKEQLKQARLPITDRLDDDIDCLLMGFDTELTFSKLEDACILLGRGVDYIATNPDWVCPTSYGFVPDCGSVAEMLFRATGRRPRFIGKPEPAMILLAAEKADVALEDAIIFGDRLYTDIKSGINAGITTVFVLSGEGTMADVEQSDFKPDYIFQDVREYYEKVLANNN